MEFKVGDVVTLSAISAEYRLQSRYSHTYNSYGTVLHVFKNNEYLVIKWNTGISTHTKKCDVIIHKQGNRQNKLDKLLE